MKLYLDERELDRRRFEAAIAAMTGLLADPEDLCERKFHFEDVVYPDGRSGKRQFFDETCAQATARLAVEHADALLAELAKEKSPSAQQPK